MIIDTLLLAKKRWLYILIFVGSLSVTAFFYAKMQVSKYSGVLTFVVDESSASGGGLGSIVGRLGLGSLNPSGVNLDRIIEFSKSEYVTKRVLEDSIIVEGGHIMLADYLVDYYNMPERWLEAENTIMLGFKGFSSPINLEDRTEARVFKLLHAGIQRGVYDEDPLIGLSYNAATGIFRVVASTLTEELSYTLANSVYENLKNVYTDQAGEKDDIVIGVLVQKRDSLNNRLDALMSSYNKAKDKNTRVILARDRQSLEAYERKILQTSSLLSEVIQNVEITKFRLLTVTPAFKTIDTPFYPLSKGRVSTLRYVLAGFMTGFFISVLTMLSVVAYKSYAVSSPKNLK